VSFKYKSKEMQFRPNDGQVEDMNWTFFNPKIGSRMVLSKMFSLYAMAGYSQREPTRFDYLQDDFAPRDIKQNEINPEQVLDLEVGTEFNGKVKGKVNLFAMEFQNQIVSTGTLNNFGYPVTGNVGRSYRRGVEMDLNGKLFSNLGFWLNSSISKNAILQLNQTYYSSDLNSNQTIEYRNTSLALSPNQIHNLGLESYWFNGHLLIDANFRYVSMQYLDNTQNKDLSIPSFQTMDVQITFDPKIQISGSNTLLLKGPYRLVRVFLGFRYHSHGVDSGEPFLNLHPHRLINLLLLNPCINLINPRRSIHKITENLNSKFATIKFQDIIRT
jgi:iron complex outermembrane receptor protein